MEATTALKAGYAEQIITPPLGEKIPGYYQTRIAKGKITDLLVRATAFDDGETKAVVFSCDAIGCRSPFYDMISKKIEETCGIPADCVYLHTTHSHTALRFVLPDPEDDPVYADFYPHLVRLICDCAKMALGDLKPVTAFKIARGEAKGISFNRRFEMKGGYYKTNPSYGNPDIIRPAGPVDESLQILRILREEGEEILFVNFGTHPDTIGGSLYHYDWPGYTVDNLNRHFSGSVKAMLMNGAQGDVNHCNRFLPAGTKFPKCYIAQKMARVITGEVLKIYDEAVEIPVGKIHAYRKTIKIGQNSYDPASLPLAQEIYKHHLESLKTGEKDEFLKNPDMRRRPGHPEALAMTVPEACRIVANLKNPPVFEETISGLQIGGVGLIGIPGEPFTQIGLDIKKDSKLDMTIVNCLVNGGRAYFPTADAYAVEGYESQSSIYASDCAQLATDAGLAIRAEMEAKL